MAVPWHLPVVKFARLAGAVAANRVITPASTSRSHVPRRPPVDNAYLSMRRTPLVVSNPNKAAFYFRPTTGVNPLHSTHTSRSRHGNGVFSTCFPHRFHPVTGASPGLHQLTLEDDSATGVERGT